MSITSEAELRKSFDSARISQLADDGGGAAQISANIAKAIASVEGKIKNALIRLYTTEAIEADAGIKRIAEALVIYYLECRRLDGPTPAVQAIYQEAVIDLQNLAEGNTLLAAVPALLPSIRPTERSDSFLKSGFFEGLPE